MEISAASLAQHSDSELLEAYHKRRRLLVDKKFARDSERAAPNVRSARMFANATGRITERRKAVEASEEVASRKQFIREMTREVELIEVDVDVLQLALRTRGIVLREPSSISDISAGNTLVGWARSG